MQQNLEKLDRMARDLIIQEVMIADLHRDGFTLLSVQEPDLMAAGPTRIAFRQMMGVFAQHDKSQIVLKLRGARNRKRTAQGRCEGRKPYGTRQGEQAVLKRMRELKESGLGFDRIAAALNNEGLKPRSGERWHGIVINRILTRAGKLHGS